MLKGQCSHKQLFQLWADVMRKLVNLIADHGCKDSPEAREALACIADLQKKADDFTMPCQEAVSASMTFRTKFLLNHVILAELAPRSDMQLLLESCLRAVLPESVLRPYLSCVQSAPRPSRATLWRHRFSLHAAYLLLLRDKARGHIAKWDHLCDSVPNVRWHRLLEVLLAFC